MKFTVLKLLVVACLSLLIAIPAIAHRTGNERRTVKGCKSLLKKKNRKRCKRCVRRPRPHHYHPLKKKGKRCRPNNGRK